MYRNRVSRKTTRQSVAFVSFVRQLTLLMQGMWIIVRRQRADEKLLESEKKYRNFFNNAQIGLWQTRLSDGLFLEANQRMVEMFGYDSRDELIGRISATDYYDEPETRSRIISELKEKGEIRNHETCYRRKDGSTLWARFSGTSCSQSSTPAAAWLRRLGSICSSRFFPPRASRAPAWA